VREITFDVVSGRDQRGDVQVRLTPGPRA